MIGSTSGGAIKGHIADDDVLLGGKSGFLRRPDSQHCAGKALAEVVVGIPCDMDGDARGAEGEKALAGAAGRR